jgi:hypothetical protein
LSRSDQRRSKWEQRRSMGELGESIRVQKESKKMK